MRLNMVQQFRRIGGTARVDDDLFEGLPHDSPLSPLPYREDGLKASVLFWMSRSAVDESTLHRYGHRVSTIIGAKLGKNTLEMGFDCSL